MPNRVVTRVFWLLLTVAASMLVVGVPWLHASSKAAFNRVNLQNIRAIESLSGGDSMSSDELQRRVGAAVMDETYSQFLRSAATLAISAGAILAIAFYVRYQINRTDEASAE